MLVVWNEAVRSTLSNGHPRTITYARSDVHVWPQRASRPGGAQRRSDPCVRPRGVRRRSRRAGLRRRRTRRRRHQLAVPSLREQGRSAAQALRRRPCPLHRDRPRRRRRHGRRSLASVRDLHEANRRGRDPCSHAQPRRPLHADAGLGEAASLADDLNKELVERAHAAGVLRTDVTSEDLTYIFEQVSSLHGPTPERTAQQRTRFLTLHLDSLRAPGHTPLPGPPPTADEQHARWNPLNPE